MKTILFDLDGTLLPMKDQELFLQTYFGALAKKLIPYGFDGQELIQAVWEGSKAMIMNDGTMTNEERFWITFCKQMGEDVRRLEPVFEEFYLNEFAAAKSTTSTNPLAKACIELSKKKGYGLVLATNPLFPRVATHARIRWAGLEPEDFDLITTYENSSYCKPNLKYYQSILDQMKSDPKDCMMVGNDVGEDMCTFRLGMKTYLLTDCLIHNGATDILDMAQGDFNQLLEYIKKL